MHGKEFQQWHPLVFRDAWALTLTAYNYTITYKAGKRLNNADALSRLPQPVMSSHDGLSGDVIHLLDHLSGTTISSAHIQRLTNTEPILAQVKTLYRLNGFPSEKMEENFVPYRNWARELMVVDGCILWGARVVVGRQAVLTELHDTHQGPGNF